MQIDKMQYVQSDGKPQFPQNDRIRFKWLLKGFTHKNGIFKIVQNFVVIFGINIAVPCRIPY